MKVAIRNIDTNARGQGFLNGNAGNRYGCSIPYSNILMCVKILQVQTSRHYWFLGLGRSGAAAVGLVQP